MDKIYKKKENPASRRSKTALMIAFTNLLTQRSISEISISEITDKAGLSRQTFYTNFSTKEDILDDTVICLFDMYADHIQTVPPAPEAVIEDYFTFWKDHEIFLSVLFKHHLDHLFFTRNMRFFENELCALSESAAKNEKEIPYIKALLASTLASVLRIWIMNQKDMSIQELAELIKKLLEGRLFNE